MKSLWWIGVPILAIVIGVSTVAAAVKFHWLGEQNGFGQETMDIPTGGAE